MRINILFSMDAIQIPDATQNTIRALTAEWVIVSVVGTRQLIDAIVDPADIPAIQTMISAQTPTIIGAWTEDGVQYGKSVDVNGVVSGTAVYPFNATELAIFGGTFEHGFSGWADRIVD